MRRAEWSLLQAERVLDALGCDDPSADETLTRAWDDVLFNQFHDILGGTCLEDANRTAAAELETAGSMAESLLTRITRRAFREQAEPGHHKIIVYNPSSTPFCGLVRHEPWLDHDVNNIAYTLLDETGADVPFQRLCGSAVKDGSSAVLMAVSVPADGYRAIILKPESAELRSVPPPPTASSLSINTGAIANDALTVRIDGDALNIGGWRLQLAIMDDPTDTWSHSDSNRFQGRHLRDIPFLQQPEIVEQGPLRAAWRTYGECLRSRVWTRVMMSAEGSDLHLRLAVTWAQVRQRLCLFIQAPEPIGSRIDLVSGGPLTRAVDGLEYPLHGGLLVQTDTVPLGIVAPDVFSVSVTPEAVALTLLRSPYTAHHDPATPDMLPDQPVCDQGAHAFDIVLKFNPKTETADVVQAVRTLAMAPLAWDLTG